ncbi:hypothetical protein LAZ67_20001670 [Cordylochernes scorpioides]|uniref:HTH CENPB-type domain-containing protein n=1 Tax=Cordylochernes scorpioides TaxID=51811 RepID=A0ABY6LQ17_9ARAC|nr:hypothetical protein LAZ67_20001670 [Cordylochernes scorpioides]
MRCWTVRDDPNLLQRVITGDEAWVYGYDVETKAQSSQWKLPHEPRPKKARQVRSNVKVLLTVFFDCRGVVHHEFLPQGRTVNKEYYLQVMRNLREAIGQKCSDLWKNKNWLLHHDNAPAHTSLLVRDFLAKNNTLMMPQPPYSPDLAPCDFFLFPKLKRPMKGRRYATLDEIKTASKEELKKILKNDFLKCFEDWKNRWHKCIISHGDYFEGDKIDNDKPLMVTRSYNYLGYPLVGTTKTTQAANFFKGKALAAINATTPILAKSKINSLNSAMKLFDSIVMAVLMYAAPIWATEYKDLLDHIQDTFIRRFLNLPRYTPGYIIRPETGRVPLIITALKLTLKYWLRVLSMDTNRLPRICLNRMRQISCATGAPIGFIKQLSNLLNNNGSSWLTYCDDPDSLRNAIPGILRTAIEQTIQNDLTRITQSKEHHLILLRREDLKCTFCGSGITTEMLHYLFDCAALSEERRKLNDKTGQLCPSFPALINEISKNSSTLKRDRDGEFPEIEEALFRWIRQANAMKLAINGNILKEKAILLALKMGQDNFEASNGWLDRFKARRNISFKRLHGEAGSVDANSVATWKGGIIPSLLAKYSPQDIFNADETGLFYKLLPNQTMTIRGEKCEGGFVMDEAMEEVVEEEMNRCFEALKKHQAIDVNYIDFLEVDKDVQVAGEQSIEEIVKEVMGKEEDEEVEPTEKDLNKTSITPAAAVDAFNKIKTLCYLKDISEEERHACLLKIDYLEYILNRISEKKQTSIKAVIYKAVKQDGGMARKDFIKQLALQLMSDALNMRNQAKNLSRDLQVLIQKHAGTSSLEESTSGSPWSKKRKRCYLCKKDRRTQMQFKKCKEPICKDHSIEICLNCAPNLE